MPKSKKVEVFVSRLGRNKLTMVDFMYREWPEKRDQIKLLVRRDEYRASRARRALCLSVKLGWIDRPKGKVFHHPDYKRAFYGCWVTDGEHREIHSGRLNLPECINYWPEVRQKWIEYKRISRANKAMTRKNFARLKLFS
jgi:hypothetical protein